MTITLESLLAEMVNAESVARWPEPFYTCRQADSMDRRSCGPGHPGWFVKSCENFVRVDEVDGRKQHVLMDARGPGAIVRFFVTSHCAKPGKLRIYLDGSETPLLEYQALDHLQGNYNPGAPLTTPQPEYAKNHFGGTVTYLPLPYAQSCKVTWEEPDGGPATPTVCYQINYRTYVAGTDVETLSMDILARAAGAIASTRHTLDAPPSHAGDRRVHEHATLAPNQSVALMLPQGPGAVRELVVRLGVQNEKKLAQAMRSTVISAVFDGEQTIWCPLGDFFGAGPGLSEVTSWYREVSSDGCMVCRWLMPYAESATVRFHNVSDLAVELQTEILTSTWSWDARSMHFHANWHFDANISVPPWRDWNFITTQGKGVYVGDTLALFNPVPTWYGEGTEKIWVDGESHPSHMGTGTEDYYNFSWAPKPTFNLPFAGHVRMDEKHTLGHNVLTRTRNLDGIPFQNALQMDIEIHSWEPTTLDYAATTYWYALPGATSNVAPAPDAAARRVPRVRFRPITPFIVDMHVSELRPSAGRLGALTHPAPADDISFTRRRFGEFCDLHDELSARQPEDLLVYYACRFDCPEAMRIAALLGYDGPVKMWIDGQECFHDPDGDTPARKDRGRAELDVGEGEHDILIALGSNHGKAWGIFLRLERLDVPEPVDEDDDLSHVVLPQHITRS